MSRYFISLIICLLTVVASTTQAQSKIPPSPATIISYLLDNGNNGQTEITLNEDGTIRTIYIVGSASFSTTVSKRRAQKMATRLARVEAEKTLIRVLKSTVDSSTFSTSSFSDSNGAISSKETLTENFSSSSNGILSGLTLKVSQTRGDEYVGVFVWNATQAMALKAVPKKMSE